MFDIYLGVGGNLGSRLQNIDFAIKLITEKIAIPVKISSVYLSEPWGFEHSKYFTNAVVHIKTNKLPEELLKIIAEIECVMKRIRSSGAYEGRTMDIDILFYGNKIIKNHCLEIPHKKLHERLFVLLPMNEISPDFIHPEFNKKIKELLKDCKDNSRIRKIAYGA